MSSLPLDIHKTLLAMGDAIGAHDKALAAEFRALENEPIYLVPRWLRRHFPGVDWGPMSVYEAPRVIAEYPPEKIVR